MKETYPQYLAALKAFVQGHAPEKLTSHQLMQVMELSRIHSTNGILCYTYMSHPALLEPTVLAGFRRQCHMEVAASARQAELAKLLSEELDKQGIDHILFKGLVVRNYYPVPELRNSRDVDILIHKEDRKKSDEIMLSLGFERKEDWEPSYSYVKDAECYELHSRVIGFDVSDKGDFVGYFSNVWNHAVPSQSVPLLHAWELKPEFHFLYLLTHIAKHISRSGAGVRMYLDLAFFIRHFGSALDWDWIKGELEKLRLADFAAVALAAVKQWFGVSSPLPLKQVAQEVLDDFTDFTLAGGVFGYVGKDQGTVFLKQQNRNEETVSKFRTLMKHAFPPAKVLANKYAYLDRCPWLLPAAWVQRLVDKRSEWGRFASHTKDILTADEEKVLKLKRIYKEIGL